MYCAAIAVYRCFAEGQFPHAGHTGAGQIARRMAVLGALFIPQLPEGGPAAGHCSAPTGRARLHYAWSDAAAGGPAGWQVSR